MPSLLQRLVNRIRGPRLSTPERTLNIFKNGVREVDEGHPEKGIEYFTKAIEAAPNSAKLHHYRADAYALAGDFDRAIIDYDTAVRLNPSWRTTLAAVPACLRSPRMFAIEPVGIQIAASFPSSAAM